MTPEEFIIGDDIQIPRGLESKIENELFQKWKWMTLSRWFGSGSMIGIQVSSQVPALHLVDFYKEGVWMGVWAFQM